MDSTQKMSKPIDVTARTRPIKIAYLVPYDDSMNNHLILDAIFYESYTRWAGSYTLIVPTISDSFLDDRYASWLSYFDPDVVYAYVDLDNHLIARIDRLCCPISFLRHNFGRLDSGERTWRSYLQNFRHRIAAVSSITTVPSPHAQLRLSRRHESDGEPIILTAYGDPTEHRFVSDNFGTTFHTSALTCGAPGLFHTLCLVPRELPERMVVGTHRCTSTIEALTAFACNRASVIATFAMAHSEAVRRIESYPWADSFNLFVGATVLDRLHFWNARHFTPRHAHSLGALVIDSTVFDDRDMLLQLGTYLNNNNFLGQQNCPPNVTLRSYSVSNEQLHAIRDRLGGHTYNNVIVPKIHDEPAIPRVKEFDHVFYEDAGHALSFKVTEDANTVIADEPDHFAYIPAKYKGMGRGQWVVELSIERQNNLSRYSNVTDRWALPRRRNITKAFTNSPSKVTITHGLAILPTIERETMLRQSPNRRMSYQLLLPDDESFFRHLVLDLYPPPDNDLRASIARTSYQYLSLSDKGKNLRGVVSMFDDLYSAYEILTNRYWRSVIRSGKENSARYLMYSRNQLSGFLPNDLQTKQVLMEQSQITDRRQFCDYLENALTDTLEELVRRNVFYQVHHWRCEYCGHINTRNFDAMKTRNYCEICDTQYLAPIDLEWTYQLNDFVYRSLTKHTGLVVLWTIGFLQERQSGSFWYLPEVDLFEKQDDPSEKNEIDVLCMRDGEFIAVEAKRSMAQLVGSSVDVEKVIKKMNLIQPDVAMLAFEQYCNNQEDSVAVKASFRPISEHLRKCIDSHIEIRTIVAEDHESFREYSVRLGHFGPRSRG